MTFLSRFILIIFFLSPILKGQNFNFQWAKQFETTTTTIARTIAEDISGNIYLAGQFNGTTDFDPGPLVYNLTSFGVADIFISKLDSNGNFIWAKQMGGTLADVAQCVALDNAGNVYVTGSFQGTADFDPSPSSYTLMANSGMYLPFVAKLDPSGNFVWAKQVTGNFFGGGLSIVADTSGNTYTTGQFYSTMDFDPGASVYNLSAVNGDSFILKLDANGNFVWAKQVRGVGISATNAGASITLDGTGNLYCAGVFESNVDFDPGPSIFTYTSNGIQDFYILKLDTSGNFIWAQQIGGIASDICLSIKTNTLGEVYTTGYFNNTVDFDPGTGVYNQNTTGSFDADIFILKLNSSGGFVWAKQIGNIQNDNSTKIALDASGNIYTTGFFQGNVDFDPGVSTFSISSFGVEDAFISKLDGMGNFVWARQLGGTGADISYALQVDASNNVFTAGSFSATADFDPAGTVYNLTPLGSSGDAFISKLSNCLLPSPPTNSTAINNILICNGNSTTLTAVGSGTVMWYTLSSSGPILGTGSNFVTPTLSTGTYTYYAEDLTCGASVPRTLITVTVSNCTELSAESVINSGEINIFPNPGSGQITVAFQSNISENIKLSIEDVSGKIVFDDILNGTRHINLNVENGIYFASFYYKASGNIIVKKLVVQR